MSYVLRTWKCLNRRCLHEFDTGEPVPHCPKCDCVRVTWVPGGGNILHARTTSLDRTIRQQADAFGMSDLNSPSHSRLNRAAPRARVPAPSTSLGQVTFAPGFAAEVHSAGSTCAPSLSGPTGLKGYTGAVGDRAVPFPGSNTVPGPRANAVVHARHVTRGQAP